MKLKLNRLNKKVAFVASNESGLQVPIDGGVEHGGEGLGMRPMELLAAGLASCTSIDILLILKKKRIELSYFEVNIEAKRKEVVPSAFEAIHLRFIIGKDDPVEAFEKSVQLSVEKYCSVAASLDKGIKISWNIEKIK